MIVLVIDPAPKAGLFSGYVEGELVVRSRSRSLTAREPCSRADTISRRLTTCGTQIRTRCPSLQDHRTCCWIARSRRADAVPEICALCGSAFALNKRPFTAPPVCGYNGRSCNISAELVRSAPRILSPIDVCKRVLNRSEHLGLCTRISIGRSARNPHHILRLQRGD